MTRWRIVAAGVAVALAGCNRPAPSAGAGAAPVATSTATSAAPSADGGIGAAVPGATSAGGPFGLTMGQPLSALRMQRQLDGDSRYVITPPDTNPEFEEYIVQAPPQTGLCRVSGIGVTHHGDALGAKIRGTMASFGQALDAKYGAHETDDSLDSGSSLTQPQNFAAALDNHERTLTYSWSHGTGAHLPAGLQEITAFAKAVDADGTYLQLTYEFANYDRCQGHGDAPGGGVGKAL